jgi:hypothetical protein
MPRRSVSTVIRSFVVVAASAGFMALSGPAWSAAYAPGQQLSQQTIAEFTTNPSQLLNQFPNGGGQMISRLRDLLASDPATLAPILSLLRNATSEQKAALGSARRLRRLRGSISARTRHLQRRFSRRSPTRRIRS